jgi:OOP family OmpA-OmpF porin
LNISSVTPQVGSAQLSENTMTYTPPANYAGIVEIVYGVADGQGGTTQAVIYVTIAPPNLAPVAGIIAAGTIEQCNESSPIDVLTTASDPNGDQVRLVSANSPHGSVEILSNGLIVFTPDCDFYGNAIINYIIEDEFNMQTSASFNIEIKQVVEVIAVTESTGGSLHLFGLILLSLVALLRTSFQHLVKCFSFVMLTCLLAFNANAKNTEESCLYNDDNECIESIWPEGLFIGGQLGRSTTDIDETQLNNAYQNLGINATSFSVKDADQSSGIGFGYQFNQYFGIDFNYSDLGERHVQFSGSVLAEQLNDYYDAAEEVFPETANGLRINFTASLPIAERIKLFAQLGVFNWEQDYQTLDPQQQGAATRSGNSYPITIGAAYKFSQRLLLNIGIERMTLDQQKVSNMFVGLQYFPFVNQSRDKRVQPAKAVSQDKVVIATAATFIDSDNDGVLDNQDRCPNSSSVYMVDETGCTLSVTETISMRLNLLFALNSSQLTSTDKLEVMKLASFMQTYPDTSVVIEGHTDARGSDEYNQWLSQQRAAVVGKLLINQHNIAPERIETKGFGETQLFVDATTEAQHALNRRTIAEIIIKNVEKK